MGESSGKIIGDVLVMAVYSLPQWAHAGASKGLVLGNGVRVVAVVAVFVVFVSVVAVLVVVVAVLVWVVVEDVGSQMKPSHYNYVINVIRVRADVLESDFTLETSTYCQRSNHK